MGTRGVGCFFKLYLNLNRNMELSEESSQNWDRDVKDIQENLLYLQSYTEQDSCPAAVVQDDKNISNESVVLKTPSESEVGWQRAVRGLVSYLNKEVPVGATGRALQLLLPLWLAMLAYIMWALLLKLEQKS